MFSWVNVLSFLVGVFNLARFDKYEPMGGGFRARLAANWAAADGIPIGVGLNTSGRVVVGAGNTGVLGVVVLVKEHKLAGDAIDVMTDGEITDVVSPVLTAGSVVTADTTTGVLSNTAADATHTRVGHTIDAAHLVVRARR